MLKEAETAERPIVTKSDRGPKPTKFDITLFEKPRAGDQMTFEVNVVAESLDGMKKRGVMEPNLPTWSPFELVCDEGGALGGTDTAPPPLGYMAAGIAFCLLTHLTSFVRAKDLRVNSMTVEQRMSFATTLVTEAEKDADLNGGCRGVETHVVIEADEPDDVIADLVRVSQNACMAMQSIINPTPTNTTVHLNGTPLDGG